MPRADLVVAGSRILTAEGLLPGAVVVAGGVISDFQPLERAPRAVRRVSADDAIVIPGLVDIHVHVNQPGRTAWEGFATATRAAAAGGITAIVDMPLNCSPVTTTAEAFRRKQRAARGKCVVDVAGWGGLVPGNLHDLAPMRDAGARGFKCFLAPSGIPEFPPITPGDLRAAMRRIAELGSILLVHAELGARLEQNIEAVTARDRRSYVRYLASRPPSAELEAIQLALELTRATGCRVHIVHLSAAGAIGLLRAAKSAGLPVSAETCPHYLTFSAEEIPDGATVFKCAPPIREAANRERLWDALADATIDVVASDHSPCPPMLKCSDSGDFFRAWGGISSLELLLPATWTAARKRGFGIEQLVRWLAEVPAELAGLGKRKGRIAPGYDADLVIFEPEASWTVDPARLHQRHKLTPYAGLTLRGRVRQTFLRGVCVFDRGVFPAGAPGRWLGG